MVKDIPVLIAIVTASILAACVCLAIGAFLGVYTFKVVIMLLGG